MKSNRSFFLIIFLGASLLFSSACALSGAVQATQPTAIVQSVQSSQSTATSAPVTAASTATQPAAATQVAPALTADEVYKAAQTAWAKLEKAGPRHVSQTSYQGSTVQTNIEADSVPPNLHQVTTVMGTVVAEQYIYNGTIYDKVNGEWTQLTLAAGTFQNTLAGFAEGLADQIVLADGKVVGIEAISGKPAIEYSYTTSLKGLSVKPVTHTVWVDAISGLPVKQEILHADGEKIVQLITYDASIQITLPDEAKNAKVAQ